MKLVTWDLAPCPWSVTIWILDAMRFEMVTLHSSQPCGHLALWSRGKSNLMFWVSFL